MYLPACSPHATLCELAYSTCNVSVYFGLISHEPRHLLSVPTVSITRCVTATVSITRCRTSDVPGSCCTRTRTPASGTGTHSVYNTVCDGASDVPGSCCTRTRTLASGTGTAYLRQWRSPDGRTTAGGRAPGPTARHCAAQVCTVAGRSKWMH